MGIGFFRKLKDFDKNIWGKAKQIVGKALPVVAAAIWEVVPKLIQQAASFINPVLNVASFITGWKLAPKPPKHEDTDDYDDDNEYKKNKNGI